MNSELDFPTAELYIGCNAEDELSFNGCVFHAARYLRLVETDQTGFGWNNAEICHLTDKVRVAIESDPTVLDEFPSGVRLTLIDALNLAPALRQTISDS